MSLIRRSSLMGVAASLALAGPAVLASTAMQFTPQGTVGEASHVLVSFDAPVVALGGASAHAPVVLQCDGKPAAGKGRWLDARQWRFDFRTAPRAGTHCRASDSQAFRDLSGQPVAVPAEAAFTVAAAQVSSIRPISYDTAEVDEDQVFALWFNHAVSSAAVVRKAHCQVDGLGERVPVRVVDGEARERVLDVLYADEGETPDRLHLVQCVRRLPPDTPMRLTVASPGAEPQHYDYTVRSPFRALLSCMRERAGAPCLPLGDLTVMFSAPVAIEQARQVRLQSPRGDRSPVMDVPDDVMEDVVSSLRFPGPFPERETLTLALPEGLVDDSGRSLQNAAQFPLAVPLADAPPLVKFAAGTFGVIERFAEDAGDAPPLVPVTVRYVEPDLRSQTLLASAGRLGRQVVQDDQEALQWYARVRRLDDARWTSAQLTDIMADRQPRQDEAPARDTRGFSMLAGQPGVQWQDLPGVQGQPLRPFEVIGVPATTPGLHVLEIGSERLGQFLLEEPAPAYVRSLALVTNLGVHLKEGRDDVLVWVTTLDRGEPVAGARVQLLDCRGQPLADGTTDAQGVWQAPARWEAPSWCEETSLSGLYASARIPADHPQARGAADFSFVMSGWDRGIEPWRFNVPTDSSSQPDRVLHTVFDRNLLRRGDTVSMKHYLREQTRHGLAVPGADQPLPDALRIRHEGSGEETVLPLAWTRTASGGLSAITQHRVGDTDRLGEYAVGASGDQRWYAPARFRVEDFTPPLMSGQLQVRTEDGLADLVAPKRVLADVQLGYVAGGAAGGLTVTMSALARDAVPDVPGHDGFVFDPPSEERPAEQQGGMLLLDKQVVTLDAGGVAQVPVDDLPAVNRPQSWLFEVNYPDPNGQIQTLSQRVSVRPASVQAGLKVPGWTAGDQPIRLQALAVDHLGKALPGTSLRVEAYAHRTYTTRQRLVGGYYRYEHHRRTEALGEQCAGAADAQGLLACDVSLTQRGEIEWRVVAADAQGRVSSAAATGWLTGDDDLWFSASSDDRMDVIPARAAYRPGETAEFQVRMPFREASALVTVEREGVLWQQVVQLSGDNPVVRVPVQAGWGPNVYVSVLALRGRVTRVGWRSFLDWGWRQPLAWVEAYRRPAPSAPTAVTDLARPAFRFGLAGIRVQDDSDRLNVQVQTDQSQYQVRERATVRIQVTDAEGRPSAGATVALAAVDKSLLELSPNDSWNLLQAMRGTRSYGVRTGTAQSEIVGRRHYGRKALPAGGGGGRRPSRELLDTLLYWQPDIVTDAQGRAEVVIPLNDALTRFELAAVADHGEGQFGTGRTSFVSTQDLQLLPGVPSQVREGDRYEAMVTVRNTTTGDLPVTVRAEAPGLPALPAQQVTVPAGDAAVLRWPVTVPLLAGEATQQAVTWRFDATADVGAGRVVADAVTWPQRVGAAVPVRAQQATLVPLRGGEPAVQLPVAPPPGLLSGADGVPRGGVQVRWQSSLGGGMEGVQAWFADYPYTCFEQQASRLMVLRDEAGWQALLARVPALIDPDGLARYFPGSGRGSVVLTAYLLSISHEAQALGWQQVLPAATRDTMLASLTAFVEGRLTSSEAQGMMGDLVRLQAIEALSRYQRASARMLDTITVAPQRWPASALVDWLSIQKRVPGVRHAASAREQARQALLARLTGGATQRVLDTQAHPEPWMLMRDGATALASLVMATVDDPAWRHEQPMMVLGLLSLQRQGAWRTTTANALGTLALARHARRFEEGGTRGTATALLAGAGHEVSARWPSSSAPASGVLPWPAAQDTLVLTPPEQGPAWATVSLLGAVSPTGPVSSGYRVERRIEPVSQAQAGRWTRGDVYRVVLTVESHVPAGWVVVHDPIPAGAAILGSGLGRDSVLAAGPAQDSGPATAYPAYIERGADAYQAYFDGLPPGRHEVRYSVRLSTPGEFHLPPTRVEALYQPDLYAELPQPVMQVAGDGG